MNTDKGAVRIWLANTILGCQVLLLLQLIAYRALGWIAAEESDVLIAIVLPILGTYLAVCVRIVFASKGAGSAASALSLSARVWALVIPILLFAVISVSLALRINLKLVGGVGTLVWVLGLAQTMLGGLLALIADKLLSTK